MYTITGTAGNNWLEYCKLVLEYGSDFHDEGEKIKELLDVFILFDNFDPNDSIFVKYGNPHTIDLYKQKMISLEIIPELNTTYGKRLYAQQGFDQIKWLTDRLKRKPETKSATISLLLPDDPGPRIPCLTTIDCKVRGGKLHMTVFFRSQNVARSYANFISVHYLHEKIAIDSGHPLGQMKFIVSSAHIYERDIEPVKKILEETSELR